MEKRNIKCPKCGSVLDKVLVVHWAEIYCLDINSGKKVPEINIPRECLCPECKQDLTNEVKSCGIDIGGNSQSKKDFKDLVSMKIKNMNEKIMEKWEIK